MPDTTTDLTLCNRKGSEMSLYYDTANLNTCLTPVWAFNKAVTGDLNIGDTADKEEQSSRDPAVKYKQYTQSKPDLEITGEMFVDPLYEGYSYINSMKTVGSPKNILVLTSYISTVGAVGFKGKFNNYDTSVSGPESGPGRCQFSLAPAACVLSTCNITAVEVAVASAIVDYDPGTYVGASSANSLAKLINDSDIYKALKSSSADVVYTDIGPLIELMGTDMVDKFLADLVEVKYTPVGVVSKRRLEKLKPAGMGEFDRVDLVKYFDEIVKNASIPEPTDVQF